MPLEKHVWDVLDPNFITVTPETPLKEACTILTGSSRKKPEIHGLVVMRASGEYLGLITTKDILKYIIYLHNKFLREGKREDWITQLGIYCKDESLITVNDVMVFHEVSVRPSQKLFEVIRIMDDRDLEAIPVADAGKIIGLVRSVDILGEIARSIR
jgi:Predicted signal-transduction protein containing cAMP-binding and CBS domains